MNATSTDTIGTYECTCNSGFEGDGVNCTSQDALYIYIYIYIMLQKAAFGKDCHADAIHTLASNGNKLQLLMNPPNHMRHMFPYRY